MVNKSSDSLAGLINYWGQGSRRAILSSWCISSDSDFDAAIEIVLEEAVGYIEANANFYFDDSEDKITSVLIACINRTELYALQQLHSNGHVDITIVQKSYPMRRRLGEAKIYHGPAYHEKGLEQLVSRYSTGREGLGVLIEYVKDPGIKQLMEKIRAHLDNTKPCGQAGDSQGHRIKWTFVTEHTHESGEIIKVLHLGCNIHRQHDAS